MADFSSAILSPRLISFINVIYQISAKLKRARYSFFDLIRISVRIKYLLLVGRKSVALVLFLESLSPNTGIYGGEFYFALCLLVDMSHF